METITNLNRALAARYRIEREIGAGGMATVFAAEDVKHGRRVALKVLKPEIAAVLGVERFLTEIRVTATLHHPNLLPLFDSGDVDGTLYYVMPFIEGESLRARLDRERQLPVDDAVRIANDVAAALDYAHARGVIHRDLKPENILLQAGEPVVADFGIALAVTIAGGHRITQTGLSLGTPQYMSPEQATGDRALDARTDIYSLGAVLYEMLAGEPPHLGGTAQAVIARVVAERPQSVRVARPSVPEHVAYAVDRALEKVPADRWSTARELADALQGRISPPTPPPTTVAQRVPLRRAWRQPLVLASWAVALLAAAGAWSVIARARVSLRQSMQFVVRTRDQNVIRPGTLALSPDGRAMLYAVGEPPNSRLYLRTLDDVRPRQVPGTDGAFSGVFSPDGRSIAFQTSAAMMRVPVTGGQAVELARESGGRLSWTRDGVIVFARSRGVAKIAATGGTITQISLPDTAHGEFLQVNPIVLPDGKTVVYASTPLKDAKASRLAIGTVYGDKPVISNVPALYPVGAVDDYLLYVTWYGPMQAVRFDPRTRTIVGEPVSVSTDVLQEGGWVSAAVSESGTLAFAAGSRARELVWVDERGAMQAALRERRIYDLPRLSPDGQRLATVIYSNGAPEPGTVTGGYWSYDFATGALSRLTADTTAYMGLWAPDGRSFYYSRYTGTNKAIQFSEPADGSGHAMRLFADSTFRYFTIAANGRVMVWSQARGPRPTDPFRYFVRALDGDTSSHEIVGLPDQAFGLRLSPDGRWLAYTSWESNAAQVFVRSVASSGPRVRISTTSGIEPVWSADGKRLFYRDQTAREMYAADVRTTPTFAVLARNKLFEGPFDSEWDVADYDVTRDGKRFLMVRTTFDDIDILVTTNWSDVLRRRLNRRR